MRSDGLHFLSSVLTGGTETGSDTTEIIKGCRSAAPSAGLKQNPAARQ